MTRPYNWHGMTKTGDYKSFQHMHSRCYNPKNDSYQHYGARGIKVCERWLYKFTNFIADMGLRPPGMTIERLDVNKDYSKENCIWLSRSEQLNNTTRTIRITLDGITLTVKEWSEKTGIPAFRLRARFHRGMPPEDILNPHRFTNKYGKPK